MKMFGGVDDDAAVPPERDLVAEVLADSFQRRDHSVATGVREDGVGVDAANEFIDRTRDNIHAKRTAILLHWCQRSRIHFHPVRLLHRFLPSRKYDFQGVLTSPPCSDAETCPSGPKVMKRLHSFVWASLLGVSTAFAAQLP